MGLLGLTERQYEVCLLFYGHHMTQEQIARKLGMTQPAVHRHLAAAARKYPALARKDGHKGRRRLMALAG